MSPLKKGLLLAAVQIAIVASLGAKLAWDRARLPRVWARAASYDPSLPIRGRYLALQLEVKLDSPNDNSAGPGTSGRAVPNYFRGTLHERDGQLAARLSNNEEGVPLFSRHVQDRDQVILMETVLFLLPEHAKDPWQIASGGELRTEVTVPKKGPPRPIRLATKHGDTFAPVDNSAASASFIAMLVFFHQAEVSRWLYPTQPFI